MDIYVYRHTDTHTHLYTLLELRSMKKTIGLAVHVQPRGAAMFLQSSILHIDEGVDLLVFTKKPTC